MKVIDFQGKEHNWPIRTQRRQNKSYLHNRALFFLRTKFPTYIILEEVQIPTKPPLYLDIYIPSLKTAVECQGKQHDEFCEHYHKTLKKYARYKDNDTIKAEWCKINGIRLIEFRPKETYEQWSAKFD